VEEIFVPASGMAMEEAQLTEWLKQPGDPVAAGDLIALIETDKAVVELNSTTDGLLGRHRRDAGATVKAGEVIAYVLGGGDIEPGSTTGSVVSDTLVPEPSSDAGSVDPVDSVDVGIAQSGPEPAAVPADPSRTPHRLSPRQRRAAGVAAALSGPEVPAPAEVSDSNDRFRKAIAAGVAESWRTIPHFSVGRDVNARGLTAAFTAARRLSPSVTVTDFLLAAFGRAVAGVGQGSDLGLAVATEWGVLIPIVREAGVVPFDELARRRQAAVARARGRRLAADDSVKPYATLSNLGTMGVGWFTGIIPVGQKALLTVGEVADRAVVEGRGIAVRPQFSATLTADHRHLDGADSARLLAGFVAAIEALGEETAL
jgi:pyruvate dehydrogenase E2 component (dihydrolipoamide acetyltransferase)